MNLSLYSHLVKRRRITEKDREEFETLEFDPNELIQLNNMNKTELRNLMVFCGIRVFNGMPLIILEENEMRMAFVVWRADRINKRKQKIMPSVRRTISWITYLQKITNHL